MRFQISLLALTLSASFAFGSLPLALEAKYAEAVLAYREKDYQKTLELLEPVVKHPKAPVTFLELEALTLKGLGRYEEVVDKYSKLVKRVSPSGATTVASAPYEFELGMAKLRLKEPLEARDHLANSARFGFNRPACVYTIGTIEFNKKQYSMARTRFLDVLKLGADSLKAPAHLYLGNIGFELGSPRDGYKNMFAAREIASAMIDSATDAERELLGQTLEAANKVLGQSSKSSWRGSVGMIAGYDSNVLLLPAVSSASSSSSSGQGSVKTTLVFGLGYSGSPLKSPQLALDYQGAINLNTNADTRTGQYFTHSLEFRAVANPLDKVSWGLKLTPNFLFRVAEDGTDVAGRFAPFMTAGNVTPFIRYEIGQKMEVGLDATGYFQYYFQDSTTEADYRKSGWGGRVRAYWKSEDRKVSFNPTVALILDIVNTVGNEYRSKTLSLELSNPLLISDVLRLVPSFSAGVSYFTERTSGFRRDIPLNLGVAAAYDWSEKWSMSATLQYSYNASTAAATYQYSRFAGGLGLNYLF